MFVHYMPVKYLICNFHISPACTRQFQQETLKVPPTVNHKTPWSHVKPQSWQPHCPHTYKGLSMAKHPHCDTTITPHGSHGYQAPDRDDICHTLGF